MQLYDMAADPAERKNLYASEPSVVASLTRLLARYVTEGRSTPGVPQRNEGPKRWPQLHWLAEA